MTIRENRMHQVKVRLILM